MSNNKIIMESKIFELTRTVPISLNDMINDNTNNITDIILFNEELLKAGYIFDIDSIKLIIQYNIDLKSLYKRIKEYIGDVLSKPMYPDFPQTIKNIDDATFRTNQYMHYASTYGIDNINDIFGTNISIPQYIPDSQDTEKTKDDETLLNAKSIKLILDSKTIGKKDICDDKYILYPNYVATFILSKRERMTNTDEEIIKYLVEEYPLKDVMQHMQIPFKENMILIIEYIIDNKVIPNPLLSSIVKSRAIYDICSNSNDLFKGIYSYIRNHNWKLRTSQKKVFCKALDKFNIFDFSDNLIRSNKHREKILKILKVIDFTTYSRDDEKKQLVRRLRNKELKSWYSKLEYNIIQDNKNEVLKMLSERPTELVRRLKRLITLGYNIGDNKIKINKIMMKYVIPLHTLITVFNFFKNKFEEVNTKYYNDAQFIDCDELITKYKNELTLYKDICILCINSIASQFRINKNNIPFSRKRIFIDIPYDRLKTSYVIPNKSDDSGYIRSGISYKIPNDCNIIRFFCYWNDKNNKFIDIDLHSYAINEDNQFSHVGWNSEYNNNGICTSGDLTRSDSAEYIDIDLRTTKMDKILINLKIYSGAKSFKDIETVFIGAMAVNKIDADVKLYNSKNCFWYNNLNSNNNNLDYAIIDIKNRSITFIGQPTKPAISPYSYSYVDTIST